MSKHVQLVYFPPEVIELQKEILEHPPLMAELEKAVKDTDFVDRVAFIAAYLDIPVNEVMNEEAFCGFCDMLTMALRIKRGGVVVQ